MIGMFLKWNHEKIQITGASFFSGTNDLLVTGLLFPNEVRCLGSQILLIWTSRLSSNSTKNVFPPSVSALMVSSIFGGFIGGFSAELGLVTDVVALGRRGKAALEISSLSFLTSGRPTLKLFDNFGDMFLVLPNWVPPRVAFSAKGETLVDFDGLKECRVGGEISIKTFLIK